jgi:hypothetical protein
MSRQPLAPMRRAGFRIHGARPFFRWRSALRQPTIASATASATRMPSMAADMMPPA